MLRRNSSLDKNKSLELPVTPMDILEYSNLPPIFIVAGSKDKLARSSKIYSDFLKKNGTKHEYKVYQNANDGFFCFGEGHDQLIKDLIQFFKSENVIETNNLRAIW